MASFTTMFAARDRAAPHPEGGAAAPASEAQHAEKEPVPLFRAEVAERNWEILASRGLQPHPPRLTNLMIATLLVVFSAAGVLVVRGAIPSVEFVRGYLEPAGGVTRVRAPRQATVGAVHVRDGQRVDEGDPLVTLQSGQTTQSGATAEAEIAIQLQSQKRDLETQIAGEAVWRRNEEQRLRLEVDELAHDVDLREQTLETQREEVDLARRHAERIRELAERGTVALDELHRRDLSVC
jgi:membrane fusion protein